MCTLLNCYYSNQEREAHQHVEGPLFSSTALDGLALLGDSSAFVRSAVSTQNIMREMQDPACLTALGFTTIFAGLGGVVAASKGYHEGLRLRDVQDKTGSELADLKLVRGIVQTTAASLIVPARALALGAYVTFSQTMDMASDVLGEVGNGLFGLTSLLVGVASLVELAEAVAFRLELDGQENAYARLALLQGKDRAVLSRMLGDEFAEQIKELSYGNSEDFVDAIYAANTKTIVLSSINLTLAALSVAATVVGVVCTAPAVPLIVAGMNTFVAASSILMDLYQIADGYGKHQPTEWDKVLIPLVTLACVISVGLTSFLDQDKVLSDVTMGIGAFWLLVNTACLIHVNSVEQEA